jgi:hypothetical protein
MRGDWAFRTAEHAEYAEMEDLRGRARVAQKLSRIADLILLVFAYSVYFVV